MGKAFIDDVREFHERFGVPILDAPKMPTGERQRLRRALILEEAIETCEAIERGDIIEAADGIADLIYVAIGAALEFGIPLDRVWAEVHRSNMAKVGGSTKPAPTPAFSTRCGRRSRRSIGEEAMQSVPCPPAGGA